MVDFFRRLTNDPATMKKFFVALVGALSVAVAQGLLDSKWESWITTTVAFLTAIGVYAAPNTGSGLKHRLADDRGSVGVGEALIVLLVVILVLVIVGVI